ncbi:hypothetical protein ORL98_15240, partial [Bacillus cereus]|uniref:hypothetical protein n=1 Tax=Bacillus cereus TaxID=1396 RepID=UPI002ABFC18C
YLNKSVVSNENKFQKGFIVFGEIGRIKCYKLLLLVVRNFRYTLENILLLKVVRGERIWINDR